MEIGAAGDEITNRCRDSGMPCLYSGHALSLQRQLITYLFSLHVSFLFSALALEFFQP